MALRRRRFGRRRGKKIKARKRRRIDLRKALFILPNLLTLASGLCGFLAIIQSLSGHGPDALYRASIFILFATVFDLTDGRVARLTKTQSDMGMELDSLVDAISFGVAPAMIAYKWVLEDFGPLGLAVAFLYMAAGVVRLARFNVLSWRAGGGGSPYSMGLPIPGAAVMIIAMVLTHHASGATEVVGKTGTFAVIVILSYLMISGVRYRTFKDLFKSRVSAIVLTGGLFVGIGMPLILFKGRPEPAFVLLCTVSTWMLSGLAEEVVFFRKRRREASASAQGRGRLATTVRPRRPPTARRPRKPGP